MNRRLPRVIVVPFLLLVLIGAPIAAIAFASAQGRATAGVAPAAGALSTSSPRTGR